MSTNGIRARIATALLLWLIPLFSMALEAGGVSISVSPPDGFASVAPEMTRLWPIVQSIQGKNRVLGLYIPKSEEATALAGGFGNLDRNINIQIPLSLEQHVMTEAEFQSLKGQMKQMIAGNQVKEIDDRAIEGVNGNLSKLAGFNLHFSESQHLTLPIHLDADDRFAYSEITIAQAQTRAGVIHQKQVTSTTLALLLKGKLLVCYVTGRADDLKWSRTTAERWAKSIVDANGH